MMSTQNRSFHLSSNHCFSLRVASWSSTSTFNSPCPDKARKRQVAASQVAHDGVDGIAAKQKVELCVQRVTEEELDDDFLGPKLFGQLPQGPLVGVGGSADGELLAKLFGQLNSEAVRRLVVHAGGPIDETQGIPEVVVRKALHPDEDAAGTVALVPGVNVWGKPAPPAQVEVADAEVRPRRESQGLLQCG